MAVFTADHRHEQVVFCADPTSGLRAIVAIYSTALGPALGGTRFHPYASEEEALRLAFEALQPTEDVKELIRRTIYDEEEGKKYEDS